MLRKKKKEEYTLYIYRHKRQIKNTQLIRVRLIRVLKQIHNTSMHVVYTIERVIIIIVLRVLIIHVWSKLN